MRCIRDIFLGYTETDRSTNAAGILLTDSGLRPSNPLEDENVRKFGHVDDAKGSGQALKGASGSEHHRSQSPSAQIDPSLGADGKLQSAAEPSGSRAKDKRRVSAGMPDLPDGLETATKRIRRDSPPIDWSSATQEGRYIVALNNAFDSIREVVPGLRNPCVCLPDSQLSAHLADCLPQEPKQIMAMQLQGRLASQVG